MQKGDVLNFSQTSFCLRVLPLTIELVDYIKLRNITNSCKQIVERINNLISTTMLKASPLPSMIALLFFAVYSATL